MVSTDTRKLYWNPGKQHPFFVYELVLSVLKLLQSWFATAVQWMLTKILELAYHIWPRTARKSLLPNLPKTLPPPRAVCRRKAHDDESRHSAPFRAVVRFHKTNATPMFNQCSTNFDWRKLSELGPRLWLLGHASVSDNRQHKLCLSPWNQTLLSNSVKLTAALNCVPGFCTSLPSGDIKRNLQRPCWIPRETRKESRLFARFLKVLFRRRVLFTLEFALKIPASATLKCNPEGGGGGDVEERGKFPSASNTFSVNNGFVVWDPWLCSIRYLTALALKLEMRSYTTIFFSLFCCNFCCKGRWSNVHIEPMTYFVSTADTRRNDIHCISSRRRRLLFAPLKHAKPRGGFGILGRCNYYAFAAECLTEEPK